MRQLQNTRLIQGALLALILAAPAGLLLVAPPNHAAAVPISVPVLTDGSFRLPPRAGDRRSVADETATQARRHLDQDLRCVATGSLTAHGSGCGFGRAGAGEDTAGVGGSRQRRLHRALSDRWNLGLPEA